MLCHAFLCCAGLQIAIVGKGLTFDSGGYNLKAGPGSMIELMKVRGCHVVVV
jgi:leucyl aminopeptidase